MIDSASQLCYFSFLVSFIFKILNYNYFLVQHIANIRNLENIWLKKGLFLYHFANQQSITKLVYFPFAIPCEQNLQLLIRLHNCAAFIVNILNYDRFPVLYI